ncbi:MAG TPA: DUF2019 domain-containing protein [Streptosporangiaceae bacterium]|nr:DUF2019 domain-containing protein [Streptosporangiaceae bacterium]
MKLEWNESEYRLSLTNDELAMLIGCIAETLAYVSDVDLEAFVGWDRWRIEEFQDDLLFERRKSSDTRIKNQLAAAGELANAIEELGDIKKLSTSQLISLYTDLAIRRGIAIEEGNQHGDIRGSEQLNYVYREIHLRQEGSMTAFIRLLQHENEGVRLAAAECALPIAPGEAAESLQQLVRQSQKARIAGSAEFRLREWQTRGK